MITTIPATREVDIATLSVSVPLELDDSLPIDMPGRLTDRWAFRVDIDTGKILNWPQGRTESVNLIVRDTGTYTLTTRSGEQVWIRDQVGYVPTGLLPTDDTDDLTFVIEPDGTITGFLDNLDLNGVFQ